MTTTTTSRVRTFVVAEDFVLPELPLLQGGGEPVVQRQRVELDSAYYDTIYFDLLSADIALRHGRGPIEPGWLLDFPDSEVRYERESSPVDHSIPPELLARVAGPTRGHPVHQVATTQLVRRRIRLLDPQGRVAMVISDDEVGAASAVDPSTTARWREIVVETCQDGDLVAAQDFCDRLVSAGARNTTSARELAEFLYR